MAWVVSVTWALARFGGVLRLRADFVVTEAMVACVPCYSSVSALDDVASTGRGLTGRQPFTIHKVGSSVGRAARAVARRSAVAGVASSRGGPEAEAGRRALAQRSGLPSLLVCYMPLALVRRGRAIVDAVSSQATRQRSFRRLPEPPSTPARRARPRTAVIQSKQNAHAPAAHEGRRGQGPAAPAAARRARGAAPPPTARERRRG